MYITVFTAEYVILNSCILFIIEGSLNGEPDNSSHNNILKWKYASLFKNVYAASPVILNDLSEWCGVHVLVFSQVRGVKWLLSLGPPIYHHHHNHTPPPHIVSLSLTVNRPETQSALIITTPHISHQPTPSNTPPPPPHTFISKQVWQLKKCSRRWITMGILSHAPPPPHHTSYLSEQKKVPFFYKIADMRRSKKRPLLPRNT